MAAVASVKALSAMVIRKVSGTLVDRYSCSRLTAGSRSASSL